MRNSPGILAGFVALAALFLHIQQPPSAERTSSGRPAQGASSSSNRSRNSETKDKRDRATGDSKRDKNDVSAVMEGPWTATEPYFRTLPSQAWKAKAASSKRAEKKIVASACSAGKAPRTDQLNKKDGEELSVDSPDSWDNLSRPATPATGSQILELLGLPSAEAACGLPGKNWAIVATLPDPRHTRMAARLDAELIAIVDSMDAAGWKLKTEWLPWTDPPDLSEADLAYRQQQRDLRRRQETLPGVLVFAWKKNTGWPASVAQSMFVFTVPETPTSGINAAAFNTALQMANAVRSDENKIGLLAPSFSGSFAVLATLVVEWSREHPYSLLPEVYSGYAINQTAATEFENATRKAAKSKWICEEGGMRFHVGMFDTEASLRALDDLINRYHFSPTQVAVLNVPPAIAWTVNSP